MSTPRTRSRGSAPSIRGLATGLNYGFTPGYVNNPPKQETAVAGLTSSHSEVISDVVTPNFKKRIASGEVINNPCSYYKTERESPGGGHVFGTESRTNPTSLGSFEWNGFVTDLYLDAWGANLVYDKTDSLSLSKMDVLKQQAIARIDSSEFAFGEDALEIKETYKFLALTIGAIKRPSEALYKVSRHFKRKYKSNVIRGLNHTEALASAYLQYRFAITPLVKSIVDIVSAYSTPPKPKAKRLHARAKDSEVFGYTTTGVNDKIVVKKTIAVSRDERCQIMYEVKNPVYDFKHRLGLRGKDIPHTLWAIAPLSFMVDRAVDVTSFIKGVTNLSDPSIKILAASTSTKVTDYQSTKLVDIIFEANKRTWSVSGDEIVVSTVAFTRAPWAPTFTDTIPGFRPEGLVSDCTTVTDLLALIAVNLSPKLKAKLGTTRRR